MKGAARTSRPLRRWLFGFFTVAILVSAVLGAGLGGVVSYVTGWHPHGRETHLQRFIAAQVAEKWENPRERETFLRAATRDLALGLELLDAGGQRLLATDGSCPHPVGREAVLSPSGQRLGELLYCPRRGGPGELGRGPGDGGPPPRGRGMLIGVAMLLLVMWAATGRAARLIATPLQSLAQVADDLGRGKLSSRAALRSRHHSVAELDSLASSINQMAERIERQLRDQKELLAAVSHELRTPLGHARLLLEMAREQNDPSERLRELELELAELERMVGRLLASARLDFTDLALQPVDAVQLAVRVLERTGIEVARLVVETERPRVLGDPALLAQAVANLLENAIHHGGQIEMLRLYSAGELLYFEAVDNGPGFAEGTANNAFEAFQRGATSHGGLGLGLALVRRIAQAHGGQVLAANRESGGARVAIGIPHAPEPLLV